MEEENNKFFVVVIYLIYPIFKHSSEKKEAYFALGNEDIWPIIVLHSLKYIFIKPVMLRSHFECNNYLSHCGEFWTEHGDINPDYLQKS